MLGAIVLHIIIVRMIKLFYTNYFIFMYSSSFICGKHQWNMIICLYKNISNAFLLNCRSNMAMKTSNQFRKDVDFSAVLWLSGEVKNLVF